MGRTNEARACEVVSDVLGTVNWEMGDGGHIIIFGQSKAIHLTLNGIYTHVLKAIDKAEKRERRKAAEVFAENTALKAQIACLKYAPQFDAEKVRGLINALRDKEFELGKVFEMKDRREYLALGDSVVDAERALLAALHIE